MGLGRGQKASASCVQHAWSTDRIFVCHQLENSIRVSVFTISRARASGEHLPTVGVSRQTLQATSYGFGPQVLAVVAAAHENLMES